jgi:hypothetical protein
MIPLIASVGGLHASLVQTQENAFEAPVMCYVLLIDNCQQQTT